MSNEQLTATWRKRSLLEDAIAAVFSKYDDLDGCAEHASIARTWRQAATELEQNSKQPEPTK